MRQIRMPPDRPGGRTGRVQQNRVERLVGGPLQGIGLHHLAVSPVRDRFSRNRPSRGPETSSAVTSAPAAASCNVLPPGAAHRSSTRSPARTASSPRRQRRGRVLHPPATLGIARQCADRSPPASRRLPVGRSSPSGATPRQWVRSSGAPARCAASISCTAALPQASISGLRSHLGSSGTGSACQRSTGSTAVLRSTAFTRPAARCVSRPSRANVTAALTTPYGAPPSTNTSHSASRSRLCTVVGGRRRRCGPSSRSARPNWRSVASASRCARARSGGGSEEIGESGESIRSDRLRRSPRTPSISASAARRGAIPCPCSAMPPRLPRSACEVYQAQKADKDATDDRSGPPRLPAAAKRALAEAEARRKAAKPADLPPELGGRDGPEPVRYGDWEKKGIAVDF
jgi:hypothetical protein